VKPVDFQLHRPATVDEAVAALAGSQDSKALAGGQSLVPLLNFRLARPAHVVDLGRLTELSAITRTPEAVRVGAMVRQAYAERSRAVGADCPLLAAALPNVAHPPIRSRGTVGGSVAHADPSAEIPAVAMALDAEMVVAGPGGRRTIAAADFFVTQLVTTLAPDELLLEVVFPRARPRTGAAVCEVARRQGDFALAGVAAQVTLAEGGEVEDARICFIATGDRLARCREAERTLVGDAPAPAAFEAAGEAARAVLDPPTDLHATASYRRDVAGTLLARALREAAERATRSSDAPEQEPAA